MNISIKNLLQALTSHEYEERWFAAEILGTKRGLTKTQLRTVAKLMVHSDIGEVLCWGLGQMRNKAYIKAIGGLLEHRDTYYQWRAAHALRHIGGRSAREALETHLRRSKSSETKWKCAQALGKIGDVRSFDVLWIAAHDTNRYVRWESIWAISLLGPAVEARIRAKLLSPATNTYMQWRCLWVLGLVGNTRTIRWLERSANETVGSSQYLRYQRQLAVRTIIGRLKRTNG